MRSQATGSAARRADIDATAIGGSGTPSQLRALLERLAEQAARGDRPPAAMRLAVAELSEAGLLSAGLPRVLGGSDLALTADGAEAAVAVLVRLGGVDLSLARLYEGHLNALRLLTLHGGRVHLDRAAACIANGGLLGVWGADAETPVRLEAGQLAGAKRFCSGIGCVDLAVVPVRSADGQQLVLAGTTEPHRADAGTWDMHGMRDSHSGRFDFEGMRVGAEAGPALLLGKPDAYQREPGFLTGLWRLAAAELGGVFGLLEAAREALAQQRRLEDRVQLSRLGDCLIAAHAALSLTRAAGRAAEGDAGRAAPERSARQSIFARLAAEQAAEQTLAAVGRALGLGGYVRGTTVERRMRDLATYIRQMTPDALRERAAAGLLTDARPLAEAFDAAN